MTEVPVIVHELMRAATGNPITVRTLDGGDVILRLATVDELLRFDQEARASLVEKGIDLDHPRMSRDRAEELCAPLNLDGLR
jgi:hypothetical protein